MGRKYLFGLVLFIMQLHFCLVRADTHYYDFVLKEKNYTKKCSTKSMLVVNDSFPGPVIPVRKGDTVFVNVHNHGSYGVTIHWHGVKQPRNPWSDGPEYVTQCPIEAGSNFTYEVIFSTEEGTLWWHAHSDWTRASVHGAIVVLPTDDSLYPFPKPDDDEIVVIAAWYTGDVAALVQEALAEGSDLPHSNGYTINGELGDFASCSNETTHQWMVDYGKTYLLRVVNAVMNAEIFFAVAEHNLTVVGTDGNYIKPFTSNFIVISPGQTIDVLLSTNQSHGRYYMACRQFSSENLEVTGFDHSNGSAIVHYRGNYSYSSSPIFPSNLPNYFDNVDWLNFTAKFRSLGSDNHPVNVPQDVSTKMYVVASMNLVTCPGGSCPGPEGDKLGSSLNNFSWTNPTTDVLLAYYRNISGIYTTDFPDWPLNIYNFTDGSFEDNLTITGLGTKVKVLNYNESVEIVFQGTDLMEGSVNHPMHLHGYSFYIVGRGTGNFNNETDPQGYNLVDPPEVNTFSIPKNGWLAIRFTASNPGVWFWHCHLDRHLTWGMDTVFIVKNGETTETSIREPPPYLPPCKDTPPLWLQDFYTDPDPFIV